jgi:AraC-like DNA-binding protein
MRELGFESVSGELLARRCLPRRRRMPLALSDILDGTFTNSVYLYAPVLQALMASGQHDLEVAYAEFRLTNLNPLAAVYRSGIASVWDPRPTHRLDDLTVAPYAGWVHWPSAASFGDQALQARHPLQQHNQGMVMDDRALKANTGQHKMCSLSEVAAFLHLEGSFTSKALQVLEAGSHLTLADVATRLACSPRTLERHLHDEGSCLETLRSAVRLLKANAQLRTGEHLSTIALAQGFSDQAHMNRAFSRACGLTPRTLQRLYTGQLPVSLTSNDHRPTTSFVTRPDGQPAPMA